MRAGVCAALAAALLVCLPRDTTSCLILPNGARLNNLKVLSNRTEDVTSVESILRSFVKPGMSDSERATALWLAAVKYRHQTAPPNEHLAADWEAHDPVKLFNVYGYCMCCCASSIIAALNRADGREARGRILNGHSVPEVLYDGGWHMFDASLLTWFPKPDGAAASVDEISAAVKEWLDRNPGFRADSARLLEFMRADGWTGWKRGPALLAANPFYELGWLPAKTHGWNDTMVEYDRRSELYEYGYQLGHRALFSLRPGESFIREAGNRGLHVNGDSGFEPLKQSGHAGDLAYLQRFFPEYTGAVVANGIHRYTPDLKDPSLPGGADSFVNLEQGRSPLLRPAKPAVPAEWVFKMKSPWVYLGGRLRLGGIRSQRSDLLSVSLSTNNGRTFRRLWSAGTKPASTVDLNLTPHIARRYACLVKVEMKSARQSSCGIDSLAVENDFQHAPRTLPWLGTGDNALTVAAEPDSKQGTRTVSCRITPDTAYTLNESTSSMGVAFENLSVQEDGCWWKEGVGAMTVPVETPGPIAALRFGAHVRARGEKDRVRILGSFDGGRAWTEMASIFGPTPGVTRYFRFDRVPSGARKALVRYELSGNNTIGIFSFRVDADYLDPKAAAFRPFHVVHRWKEKGEVKTHTERIPALPHAYRIRTESQPEMVSVTYQMP